MNKEIMKLTLKEVTRDKKRLAKTSLKIGGIILTGKIIKDVGNTTYNGVKKNTKKANENRKRIKANKKKIKNSKEYLKKLDKKKDIKLIRKVDKDISCLQEKNKCARKNILKHSSLAITEALALPVTLGVTGVVGFKMFEIERNVVRETVDEIESIYRGIEYDMEDETW